MKDYTLAEDQVSREAKDWLDYLSKGAQHFKAHGGQLYWQMEGNLGMTTWTERQVDIHSIPVRWDHLVREAFKLHQAAINDRNWDAVEFTYEQLRITTGKVFTEALEHLQEMTIGSTRLQRIGKKGGRPAKKRDEICRDYDRWMAQGDPRALVIQRLANTHHASRTTINRILLKEGRGTKHKVSPAKNHRTKA